MHFYNKKSELLKVREHFSNLLTIDSSPEITRDQIEIRLKQYANYIINATNAKSKKSLINNIADKIYVSNDNIKILFKSDLLAHIAKNGDPYGIRTRVCMRERHVSLPLLQRTLF